MQKYADYIEQVEIESLWSGRRHVEWNLDRKVNVLSGINGVGKSTILNKLVKSVGITGDIYICTTNFVWGDGTVYHFNAQGKYVGKFASGGQNPKKVVFLN